MGIAIVKELPAMEVLAGKFSSDSDFSYAIDWLLTMQSYNDILPIGARLSGPYDNSEFALSDGAEIDKVNCEGIGHLDDENIVVNILCNLRHSDTAPTIYSKRGRVTYNPDSHKGEYEIFLK
jgi:hypothetical protein